MRDERLNRMWNKKKVGLSVGLLISMLAVEGTAAVFRLWAGEGIAFRPRWAWITVLSRDPSAASPVGIGVERMAGLGLEAS